MLSWCNTQIVQLMWLGDCWRKCYITLHSDWLDRIEERFAQYLDRKNYEIRHCSKRMIILNTDTQYVAKGGNNMIGIRVISSNIWITEYCCSGISEFFMHVKGHYITKMLSYASNNPVWSLSLPLAALPWFNCKGSKWGFSSALVTKHIEAATKWPPFCWRHFQMHSLEWKWMYFDWNFTEVYS